MQRAGTFIALPMPLRFHRVYLTTLLGLIISFLPGEIKAAGRTVRLLTIGNSFSRDATKYLGDLAKASNDNLIHQSVVVAGASLQLHWTKAAQHEQNASDARSRYADGSSLNELLRAAPWDYVTIQQASILSHQPATYRPFAVQLYDYIKARRPLAEVLLHQTWEYRSDDPRFTSNKETSGEPRTAEEMYHGLATAYATIARELGVRLVPVGDAFHRANQDSVWGYRAPASPMKHDSLPPQPHSLNVGWQQKQAASGSITLTFDGHHASLAGQYLGACVWYEILFEQNVQMNTFVPIGLDPEYARFLRETAHHAVQNAFTAGRSAPK